MVKLLRHTLVRVVVFGLTLLSAATFDVSAEDRLVMRIPPNVGNVRFGDPVFVPIAIANLSQKKLIAPEFASGIPSLFCQISFEHSQQSRLRSSFLHGSSTPRTHELAPRSVESTVLAVNIWHPNTCAEAMQNRVELVFEGWEDLLDKHPVVRGTTSLKITGTAFTDQNEILLAGKNIRNSPLNDVVIHSLTSCINIYDVLYFGPLAWLDPDQEKLRKQITTKSDYYKSIRGKVVKDSALYRLFQLAEFIEQLELVDANDSDQITSILSNFRHNLENTSANEYQFHVRSLTRFQNYGPSREMKLEMIANEFADVLGFVDASKSGGLSTISLIPNRN